MYQGYGYRGTCACIPFVTIVLSCLLFVDCMGFATLHRNAVVALLSEIPLDVCLAVYFWQFDTKLIVVMYVSLSG